MSEDLGDKTEPASARRRSQARQQGSMPRSTELASALILTVGFYTIIKLSPQMFLEWKIFLESMLLGDWTANPLDLDEARRDITIALLTAGRIAAPFLVLILFIVYASYYWQVGWLLTTKPLTPSLAKLNPISGVKKMFSLRKLMAAGVSVAKVSLIVTVTVLVVRAKLDEVLMLPRLEYLDAALRAIALVVELCWWILPILVLLGLIDYIYQKWQWEEENKMSKQEVRDEMKQMIGDPKMKKRQRNFAMEILNQRIATSVPQADVIVTNPEHLAIALQWDPTSMTAPKVLAKGADYMALRIRQIGGLHRIPIVERKPLARAMYPLVEVGKEIPPQFYGAVAEVLAYVYRLEEAKAA